MANFAKTRESAIFGNSLKGGPRENRSKSRPNSQSQKTPRSKSNPQWISMGLMCNHRTTFCRKPWLLKCWELRAMANFAKTRKSAIFGNFSKGGPRENCSKSSPSSQAQITPGRKSHTQLISMRLMCNHGTTFCRKPWLQKCSQFRAMANFAKTPKSTIFFKFFKGGTNGKSLKK